MRAADRGLQLRAVGGSAGRRRAGELGDRTKPWEVRRPTPLLRLTSCGGVKHGVPPFEELSQLVAQNSGTNLQQHFWGFSDIGLGWADRVGSPRCVRARAAPRPT
jgi:hypothetical protein